MVVLLHVIAAISSLVLSAHLFFAPTKTKLYATCGLVGTTLLSGTYLVWSTHGRILQTCLMGLAYIGFTLFCLAVAQSKLAKATQAKD